MQKLSKGKPARKGRTAAAQRKPKRPDRIGEAEIALATLLALLHADRWLFEAAELAARGKLQKEADELNRIRLSIVGSLNRLQPRAYGAMNRNGYLGGSRA